MAFVFIAAVGTGGLLSLWVIQTCARSLNSLRVFLMVASRPASLMLRSEGSMPIQSKFSPRCCGREAEKDRSTQARCLHSGGGEEIEQSFHPWSSQQMDSQ